MEKYMLRQYRGLLLEIEGLEAEKQALYSVSATTYDGLPKGGVLTDLTDTVQRLDRLQELIDAKLDALIKQRSNIEQAIDTLPPRDRTLMRLRYIDGHTWEQIASEMAYSVRQVIRRHRDILQNMS